MTYTNPHRWSPGAARPGREAVAALVRSYLHAYGPASADHFARWLNIPPRSARAAFEEMGDAPSRSSWTASRPGSLPATPRSRPDRPGPPPPPLLRCRTWSRVSPARACSRARPRLAHVAIGPGRQLPGPADRWRRRRGLAPAAVRPAGRDHRRDVAASLGVTAARARGGSRDRGHGARRRAGADDRDGRGRRPRLIGWCVVNRRCRPSPRPSRVEGKPGGTSPRRPDR